MGVSEGTGAAVDAPSPALRAIVVVPAHDEETRVGLCLDALASQVEIESDAYEVIVVIDECSDDTLTAVEDACRRWPALSLRTMAGPGRGAGPARAIGMDAACSRLESVGRTDGLLASTDADSVVASDWLARQLEAIADGAEAIGGEILLDSVEASRLPAEVVRAREAQLAERTRLAGARGPAEHAHFSGASLGLTPRAYRSAGGMGWLAALEDRELEDRLVGVGIEIHRLRPVRVTTSARTDGRAERGLARDLALGAWIEQRSYDGSRFELDQLLAAKRGSVAAILPAREVAATIGPILDRVKPLHEAGLVDELLVIDADSADGSAEVARGRGVEVISESALRPELGPCLGKGDAMWRAAGAVESDLLVFLDADSADFDPGFVTGLLGPILLDTEVRLVKGAFRRPFAREGLLEANEGGRVTELVARPLLNLRFPDLAGFVQPLAGEIAIERDLFQQLSVPVGYGVEIAMLIDCLRLAGLDALAQSDLGSRQNRHQPLRALSAMAFEVMTAVERRTGGSSLPDGAGFRPQPQAGEAEIWRLNCAERPPLASRPVPSSVHRPATRLPVTESRVAVDIATDPARMTVVLDVDGTLVDTNYQHAIAWHRALRAHGYSAQLWEIHRHIGMGGDQIVAALIGKAGEEEAGDAIRASEGEAYGELIGEVQVMDGARELIADLREEGTGLILASSAKAAEVDHYLDLLDARELVDDWTTAADVERTKPDPDLIHAALDKSDRDGPALMIGDSTWDVKAAKAAGIPTLAVLTGGFSEEELREAGAAEVVESIGKLRVDRRSLAALVG